MMEDDGERFWSEIGKALTPRGSDLHWSAAKARVMSRVKEASERALRPWIAAGALCCLALGWFVLSRVGADQAPFEIASTKWDVEIHSVAGTATVFPAGRTEGIPATAGLPLFGGDEIRVDPDSRVELAISSRGIVALGSLTNFTVTSLEKPRTIFGLETGSLVAELDWAQEHAVHRLDVVTPTAVASVRGTQFGVAVAADGATSVGVFEHGAVAVRAKDAPSVSETTISPHQELSVPRGEAIPTESRDNHDYLRVTGLSQMQGYQNVADDVHAHLSDARKQWKDVPEPQRSLARARIMDEQVQRVSALPPEQRDAQMQRLQRPSPAPRQGGAAQGGEQRRATDAGPQQRTSAGAEQGPRRSQPHEQRHTPRAPEQWPVQNPQQGSGGTQPEGHHMPAGGPPPGGPPPGGAPRGGRRPPH